MQKLLEGHHDVKLSADDTDRLITWMDANALFYGTFDPPTKPVSCEARSIAGPGLRSQPDTAGCARARAGGHLT